MGKIKPSRCLNGTKQKAALNLPDYSFERQENTVWFTLNNSCFRAGSSRKRRLFLAIRISKDAKNATGTNNTKGNM